MENQLIRAEQKLSLIARHAPMGLAEIDSEGGIIEINLKGESLLKPVIIAHDLSGNNFYEILAHIAPGVTDKIKATGDSAGHILANEPFSFYLSFGGEQLERHFTFTIIKLQIDCIIICFHDLTQKRHKEDAIQDLVIEKAVLQGKFEIASNILHDIGNAIVGFGSYINRIRRSTDQVNPANLQKLAEFMTAQAPQLNTVMGDAKADALVKMLAGINESQKTLLEDIRKSVSEQHNIITHVQDILTIQRQYVAGNETQEKKPVNLRSIISDCMSMVYASIEKRAIIISMNVPEVLPVIKGDRTRLMQVILNIIKNSIEAIDITASEKKIALCLGIKEDRLVFQLMDNGHGFDEATGKQLFERGFTTKASGSGLGLYSCRSIIENHDGTIEITSEGFGKGALTTITFKI
jgi:signal transduction histidine kinase